MTQTTIKIKSVEVELYWEQGGDSLGTAVCTVLASDLDRGVAGGPVDGETFRYNGQRYHLGQHDYETEGDYVTCSAPIYETSMPLARGKGANVRSR